MNNSINIEDYRHDSKDFQKEKNVKPRMGGSGIIFFGLLKTNNQKCVCKRTKNELKGKYQQQFYREIEALAKFQNPAIVPFLGFSESKHGFIYLKRMEKGSLYSLIHSKKDTKSYLDMTHKYIISYGVACAMQCLHKEKWIHRDLKSENILLDEELRPFLTDFGTSKQIDPKVKINQTTKFTSYIIMAPEFIDLPLMYSNSLPIDVYSYGITLYELFTSLDPYPQFKDKFYQLKKFVCDGGRPQFPDYLHKKWKNLIEKCWSQDPSDRPKFDDIVATLESDEYLDDEIDKDLFNEYKLFLSNNIQNQTKILNDNNELENNLNKLREEAELELKSKTGNISSLFCYAVALFEGTFEKPNLNEAFKYCIEYVNHPNAQKNELKNNKALLEYYIGIIYSKANKFQEAKIKLENSTAHGNADAAFYLAELKENDEYIIKDMNRREQLYERAANGGCIEAIKKYAKMQFNGEFSGQSKKKLALDFLKKGSDNGEPELMYMWAIREEYGIDIDMNKESAMLLMELLMKKNYLPALVNYAFHLYNGIILNENKKHAAEYFQIAADEGYPEAILWDYVISSNNGNVSQKQEDSFKSILNNDDVVLPDAWSVYGINIFQEHTEDGIDWLKMAVQYGSVNAMLFLGEICENDDSLGDKNFYFERAAHHCHLLDKIGFFTPIELKVFHCDTCNIDMCEGCAKYCHRHHSSQIHEIGKQSAFKCACGADGFHDHCSGEFVGEEMCYQHLYQCSTCSTNSVEFICKSCAENCHKGHVVVDCGIQKNFCSCGMKNLKNKYHCKLIDFNNNLNIDFCSSKSVKQRWFKCIDCQNDDSGICQHCALTCHEDHNVIDLGVKEEKCSCTHV